MYIEKKCVSDKNYLIKYPEFVPGKPSNRKEKKAVRRMNGFYRSMIDEIISYGTEISREHPKAAYIINTECEISAANEGTVLNEGEFALDTVVSVHIALILRLRPEPTRRRTMVHTWQRGFLLSVK